MDTNDLNDLIKDMMADEDIANAIAHLGQTIPMKLVVKDGKLYADVWGYDCIEVIKITSDYFYELTFHLKDGSSGTAKSASPSPIEDIKKGCQFYLNYENGDRVLVPLEILRGLIDE